MRNFGIVALFLTLLLQCGDAGSPCPNMKNIYPCFCSSLQDGTTIVICSGIQNTTELELVTKPLKSQIIDRLILLNLFFVEEAEETEWQENVTRDEVPINRLPKKWLAELRVRELEILNGHLYSCLLCDDAFEGQADFLTSLTVKHGSLTGHVCSTCSVGNTSVSTRELRRTPKLRFLDFSFNEIEFLDGNAFPAALVELKKIVLSNNRILKIHDNAFSTLSQLNELDLSRNQLSSVSRKMFRSQDRALRVLDLSHNSIQSLPDDMFHALLGLREVKISNNLLETLPLTTWSRIPVNMEKIDVKGNFLVCNCTMNWIRTRLSKSTKLSAHCVAPKEAEFQDLKSDLSSIAAAC